MDPRLLIINIGFLMAIVALLGLGVYVLFLSWSKFVRFLFFLASLSAMVAMIAHLAGINVVDSIESQQAFLWTLMLIPTAVFITHWGLILIGRNYEKRRILVLIYSIGLILTIFFLLFPDTFLLSSIPTGYSPNFYQPGAFHLLFWLEGY